MWVRRLGVLLGALPLLACAQKSTALGQVVSLQQVPPPKITQFSADNTSLPPSGGTVTFSWQTTGATLVLLDNGGGDVTTAVTKSLAVTATTTFQLAALNGAGSDVKTITVTVASSPPVIVGFAASQTALPYGGGNTVLSWNVDNAQSLSLSPMPGDVTASTFYSANLTASTMFTLTATNAVGSTTATVNVDVSLTTTITGKVITEIGAQAVTGAKVQVLSGAGSSATTDASGAFTLPGVAPPYDVAVATASGHLAIVYRQLTRLDPTLMLVGVVPAVAYSAGVSGNVAGGTATTLVEYVVDNGIDGAAAADGSGNYAFTPSHPGYGMPTWYGAPYENGSIFAIDLGPPVKFASEPLTLAANGVFDPVNLTLATIGSFGVSGVCTPPAPTGASGYTVNSTSVGSLGPVRFYQPAVTAQFFVNHPNIPGTITYAQCDVQSALNETVTQRIGGLPAATGVINLAPPPAAKLLSPNNGASSVGYGSTLSWGNVAGGYLHLVTLVPKTGPNPEIEVLTASTSETLPNLSGLLIPMSAGSGYTWSVQSFGPTVMDNVVGPTYPSDYTLQSLDSYTVMQSASSSFTAP